MRNFATAKLAPIDLKELVGKTIAEVDGTSANVLLVAFTDGTDIAIQSHHDHTELDTFEVHQMEGGEEVA